MLCAERIWRCSVGAGTRREVNDLTVYLIPNLQKENAAATARRAADTLRAAGAHVLLPAALRGGLAEIDGEFAEEPEAFARCDAIVTVGGDGTILHAARQSFGYDKPLLGVNLGRLGFLATVEADELEKLERLARGAYTHDRRALLAVSAGKDGRFHQLALNDAVISKNNVSQTLDVEIFCDDIPVGRYQGDGVVIATPTGSTAYSLSAGGPILDAHIAGLVVTPICAHSLHSAPMVFSAKRRLRVTVSSRQSGGAWLSCDGSEPERLDVCETVTAALSEQSISLVCFNEADQFEAIDKKLKGR